MKTQRMKGPGLFVRPCWPFLGGPRRFWGPFLRAGGSPWRRQCPFPRASSLEPPFLRPTGTPLPSVLSLPSSLDPWGVNRGCGQRPGLSPGSLRPSLELHLPSVGAGALTFHEHLLCASHLPTCHSKALPFYGRANRGPERPSNLCRAPQPWSQNLNPVL